MAKGQITTKIPAELESAALGGVVASTESIYDYIQNKTQEELNSEFATNLSDWNELDLQSKSFIKNKPDIYTKNLTNDLLNNKVDKVEGKGLSTNDYTTAEKNKLAGIETGAQANVIESISVNGTPQSITNKNVALTVMTNAVNDLVNYYRKSETYTQAEVDALISAIITLDIKAVNTLPTTNISTTTIYLVPKAQAQTQNAKDEYINTTGTSAGWEKIGDTEIDLSNYVTTTALNTALANKVNKVTGKGLSTNDYTTIEKNKLAGIESGAEVNVQANWNETDNTSDAYIKNKPTIPAAQVQSDWNATSGMAQILNKPTDTQLQADWTQINKYDKSYIKHKPYFSGYYIAVNEYISSREYVGVEKPSDKPDSTYPYLYYYNGSRWRLIDKYIEPDPENIKYYVVSTGRGYYRDSATGSEYYYPEGFVGYAAKYTITGPILLITKGYTGNNYIKHSYSNVEPTSDDGTNYKSVLENIEQSAYISTLTCVPPLSDGFCYIFSIPEEQWESRYSDFRNWTKEAELSTNATPQFDIIGEFENYTKTTTGYDIWKWNNTKTHAEKLSNPTGDDYYKIAFGKKDNDGDIPVQWGDDVWRKNFLSTILRDFLIANSEFNFASGWSTLGSGVFKITGLGGWCSGLIDSPNIKDGAESTPMLYIPYMCGQVTHYDFTLPEDKTQTVSFTVRDVWVGLESDYLEIKNTFIGSPATKERIENFGYKKIYNIIFGEFKYNIVELKS